MIADINRCLAAFRACRMLYRIIALTCMRPGRTSIRGIEQAGNRLVNMPAELGFAAPAEHMSCDESDIWAYALVRCAIPY
jgi:hypothetical protein